MSTDRTAPTSAPRRMPAFAKAVIGLQAFLLRRNWAGPMGNFVMVITTTGRKSGRKISTPVSYVRDGEAIVSLTRGPRLGGISNWYRNMLRNPEVTLEIQGRALQAKAEPVRDPAEQRRLFDLYRQSPDSFRRIFGLAPDAPAEALARVQEHWEFVRFHPVH